VQSGVNARPTRCLLGTSVMTFGCLAAVEGVRSWGPLEEGGHR
jgi:hypothetical protein